MKNEKERHFIESFFYFIFLAVFIILFWVFKSDRVKLIWVSGFGCATYAVWGILHHIREGRARKEIILEYLLLGTFVFLLLFTAVSN